MLARHLGQRRITLRCRAVPVGLVPVRAEQLLERIAGFQRDADAERTLNAHVGAAQVVRSGNTHEISERQGPKAALGYEAPPAPASPGFTKALRTLFKTSSSDCTFGSSSRARVMNVTVCGASRSVG